MPAFEAAIDVALVDRPVTPDDLHRPAPASCGAESVFLGRTRAESHAARGELVALDYDAYAPMAERVIRAICADAATASGARAIIVRHAVGRVPIGAASVGIAVWAGHREDAFGACRLVIDRLKAEAPIWKREAWFGGHAWQAGSPVAARERAR